MKAGRERGTLCDAEQVRADWEEVFGFLAQRLQAFPAMIGAPLGLFDRQIEIAEQLMDEFRRDLATAMTTMSLAPPHA